MLSTTVSDAARREQASVATNAAKISTATTVLAFTICFSLWKKAILKGQQVPCAYFAKTKATLKTRRCFRRETRTSSLTSAH